MTSSRNPLRGHIALPAFDKILPEHVIPAVDEVLATCEQRISEIEKSQDVSWQTVVAPLQALRRELHSTWSPIQHLIGVKNSQALRDSFEASLPKIVSFSLRLSQSKPIYASFKLLSQSADWQNFSPAQKRTVEQYLLNAKLSGIELEGSAQSRFNEISQLLSQLQTQFSNNVLDATKDYILEVNDPHDMKGIPQTFKGMWAEKFSSLHSSSAKPNEELGPWAVGLNFSSFMPFMKYCRNRSLREQLYRAYVTRASSGKFDNKPLIKKILKLRREQANLLGFNSYAELSLISKMAGQIIEVDKLLSDLSLASRQKARDELDELRAFAKKHGLSGELLNWDIYFYLELMRQEKFDISDDELRPYFPLPRVLDGLFSLLQRLFGIKVVQGSKSISKWHPDVDFYDIFNEQGELIAGFYLDPYARPEEKRGGAWMDTCLDRGYVDGRKIFPVAYLVCNGTPPVGHTPSLLSFEEVETLFHEFGHGLQHMLTQVDELDTTGINGIEWDAVELPSQFMENWCYQRSVIKSLTKHVETGLPLPDDLFQKLTLAKTFNAGNIMVRQLHFALVDLALHHDFDPDGSEQADQLYRRIASQVAAIQPIAEDQGLCTFEHIFSGSYAAGYYSYKWAEVLSADAFSRFEEEGLDNEEDIARVGREFRDTVLALGGSIHPLQVFQKFRGRKPEIGALLRHNGF